MTFDQLIDYQNEGKDRKITVDSHDQVMRMNRRFRRWLLGGK